MARKDSLLKLHRQLMARRNELLRSIDEELCDLRRESSERSGGDDVDAAVWTMNTEMTSQLAQLESKELRMIERAILRLHEGSYGKCEGCNKKIPVARLNALPYTTLCIQCQRDREANPNLDDDGNDGWQKVYDSENSSRDISVNLSDLEYHLG